MVVRADDLAADPVCTSGGAAGKNSKQELHHLHNTQTVMDSIMSKSLLTRVGEFWSGQKDSGMGQCPTGTPVFGFGRT